MSELPGGMYAGNGQRAIEVLVESNCASFGSVQCNDHVPIPEFHTPPKPLTFAETLSAIQLMGESTKGRMDVFADGPARDAMLEGAAHVRVHVTFFGAGGRHRGCDCAAARPGQDDAWRLSE